MRKKKGITLIALVITIIVLLILAGVSLSLIAGENGILGRATSAVKKNKNAMEEEEISLAVSDKLAEYYETDRSKTLFEYFNENLKNYETPNGAIIDCKDGVITYNGSQMATIDEKGKITFDKGSGIEISYNATEVNENNVTVTVTIIAKQDTIKQIQKPDGSIENGNGRERIEFSCILEVGKEYKIKATSESGIEKEETLNFRNPAQPIKATMGYPKFTLMGVETPKVEIQYDESADFENYYSIDNGETWNLYVEPFSTTTKEIKAKSVHKKCPEFCEEVNLAISIPNDSIDERCYDGLKGEYQLGSQFNQNAMEGRLFAELDESTWGAEFCCWAASNFDGYARSIFVQFLNSEGEKISEVKQDHWYTTEMFEIKGTIPEGCEKVCFYGQVNVRLYEFSIIKE